MAKMKKADTNALLHTKQSKWVINPDSSQWLRRWDIVTTSALIFVCFVTPAEIAFAAQSQDKKWLQDGADALFWINRFVDSIFVWDMALQLVTMYPLEMKQGTVYVGDHRAIAQHYIKTWFVCDFVSILPFDLIGILMSDGQGVSKLKMLRMIRLLRLLKLARLLRGMRIIKRWEVECDIQYRKLSLCGLVVTVLIAAHWLSCFLGLLHSLQGESCISVLSSHGGLQTDECIETWLSARAVQLYTKGEALEPSQLYLVSLYVATTFIVHPHSAVPQSDAEVALFIILQFLGGFLWTKVISRSTALTTSMDRHNINFHQTMDDLNAISADYMLPHELRRRLRAYFMSTKDSSKRSTWKDITGRMSPALRTEVAYQQNRNWLMRVPYMVGTSKFFLQEVSSKLASHHYSERETFGSNFTLYIMFNGLCTWYKGTAGGSGPKSKKTSLLTPGAVWGEEHLLLNAWHLLIPNAAKSLGFSEVLSLDRNSFWAVCDEYPEYHGKLRKFFVRYALVNGILYEADRIREQERRLSKEDPNNHETSDHHHSVQKQQLQMQKKMSSKDFRFSFTAIQPQEEIGDVERAKEDTPKGRESEVQDMSAQFEERLTAGLNNIMAHTDSKLSLVFEQLAAIQKSQSLLLGEVAGLREAFPQSSWAAGHGKPSSARPVIMPFVTSTNSKVMGEGCCSGKKGGNDDV